MGGKINVLAITVSTLLVLTTLSSLALAKVFFKPNYSATFTGDISGNGLVEVIGNFIEIRSDPAKNDFKLTFSGLFNDYSGDHYGYLYMKRTSATSSIIEIFFTYGPEDGAYYELHGFGTFEGNIKIGWFRISSSGTFSLSKDVGATGNWVEVWSGTPNFVIEGKKL